MVKYLVIEFKLLLILYLAFILIVQNFDWSKDFGDIIVAYFLYEIYILTSIIIYKQI
jgi:hypothetical protein